MKKICLTAIVLTFSTLAMAGTGRNLSMSEQKLIAYELAQIIPSLAQGDSGTLDDCTLMNAADPGTRAHLQVVCVFEAPSGLKADAIFDVTISNLQLTTSSKPVINGAKFKALIRQ